MQILVTGLSGNLGQAIKRRVPDSAMGLERSEWNQLESKLQGQDLVIHAASDLLTSVADNPVKVFDSNLMTTVRLLEALKTKPGHKLMFISSCAVYGHSSISKEDVPPAPISLNGVTKLLNERFIFEFCHKHHIPFTIVRLFNTFGGADRFSMLHHLEQSVKNKRPFHLFNGGLSQRDFIHVDDAARVILQIADKPNAEGIFNVGSGQATRVVDVVNAFKKKNPSLEVVNKERIEAEYSRADLAKLSSLITLEPFIGVLDFLGYSRAAF